MEKSKISLYVLHGAWGTQTEDSQEVLGVSAEIQPLEEKLSKIANNRAEDYIGETYGDTIEDQTDRSYTLTDSIGEYTNFFITEHQVELPEEVRYQISREVDKECRMNDIACYLQELWEGGNLEDWKYEYMRYNPEVIQGIFQKYEKYEDCNTSHNATMDAAYEEVSKGIVLDDKVLEFLWRRFGNIPVDDDGITEEDFIGYPEGTDREDIWKWFDKHHSVGVVVLMNMEG